MQELEKILEETEQLVNMHYEDDSVKTIIMRNMREIRKHMNDGWIPVEERLPEDGTYLCTLAGELCGIEEPFTGMCGIENGIWDEPDCVIAWRPLPEPYHAERSRE